MSRITYNLRRWYEELLQIRSEVTKAVFMEILPDLKPSAHRILADQAEVAAIRTREFGLPIFIEPLREACLMDEALTIFLDMEGQPSVLINLDKTAGRLSEYVDAVADARGELSSGKKVSIIAASHFWKNYIYRQAREGLSLPVGNRVMSGEQMYWRTVETRFSKFTSLAPYWMIIDKGNTVMPGRGGYPYPAFNAQRFTTKAEGAIEAEARLLMRPAIIRYEEKLDIKVYGGEDIIETLGDYIAIFEEEREPPAWAPGRILQEVQIKARDYDVYITRTGLLGLRLSSYR